MATTLTEAESFVEALRQQWKRIDPDSLTQLFHDDGRLLHSGMSEFIPREEIPEYFRGRLAVVPDYSLAIDRWALGGGHLFVEWTFTGTIGGERPPDYRGVHRFTLRGDKAVEAVAYYDTARMLTLIQEAVECGAITPDEIERLTAGQDELQTPVDS